MSAPSVAPSLAQEIVAPDVSSIVTEDDTPVDNIYSEKQQRLLTEALYTSWSGPPPEEEGSRRRFVAMANVGVFSTAIDPPVVPDVLVSLDVALHDDVLAKEHRTYFLWVFGKSPDLVIEVVSNRVGGELTTRKKKYRDLHVPAYVVWDPAQHLGGADLQAFELRGMLYIKKKGAFFDAMGLGLVVWEGTFEGCTQRWLRWVDAEGKLLLAGAEQAKLAQKHTRQEQKRTQRERERAQQERERAQQEQERAQQAVERAQHAVEHAQHAVEHAQQADERAQHADERAQHADERAQLERKRAEHFAARLRALGIDPDAP